MKFNVDDKGSYVNDIVIFDEQGEQLRHVQELDTETYLCNMYRGKRAVAAGFVLACTDLDILQHYLANLPDALQQFICYHEPNDNAPVQEAIQAQLEHRRKLRAAVKALKG